MGHDWVIHVLSDLRQFAEQNELPLLSEQLDEAMMTAVLEIADRNGQPVHMPRRLADAPDKQLRD